MDTMDTSDNGAPESSDIDLATVLAGVQSSAAETPHPRPSPKSIARQPPAPPSLRSRLSMYGRIWPAMDMIRMLYMWGRLLVKPPWSTIPRSTISLKDLALARLPTHLFAICGPASVPPYPHRDTIEVLEEYFNTPPTFPFLDRMLGVLNALGPYGRAREDTERFQGCAGDL
ncbi:uncharacterized protein BXZ73DRAFT_83457 [Epithele typhae]|uniref:uncharacterized protein n=1 Tax=Epithele typhae TaxID=378194 RepID=UPI002007CACB|nr:uncharacterized protein BXZ73DRAFT_83457 [Epithele typhae]KAH9910512.1 hypothetical protein BXZ73DRAFT_83457 [Epithele typhae]